MKKDLTDGVEKPLWPLSSFGPGKYENTLLKGLDESPEEMRVKAWEANRSGQALTYVSALLPLYHQSLCTDSTLAL